MKHDTFVSHWRGCVFRFSFVSRNRWQVCSKWCIMTVARDPKWEDHVNRPIQRKRGAGSWVRINCVWWPPLVPQGIPCWPMACEGRPYHPYKIFLKHSTRWLIGGEERSRPAASIQMRQQYPKSVLAATAVHGYQLRSWRKCLSFWGRRPTPRSPIVIIELWNWTWNEELTRLFMKRTTEEWWA